MDYLDRLIDKIEGFGVPMPVKIGLLDTDETIAAILAGGRTLTEFYDGTQIKQVNVDFNIKTQNHYLAPATLNEISAKLQLLSDIPSQNNSYKFQKLTIADLPMFQMLDAHGWAYYRMTTQTELIIFKGDE